MMYVAKMLISSEYDVIVVGGGSAGAVSAIAASRNGANTLLIERYGFLGGAITGQYIVTLKSFFNTRGEQIVGGIPQEIVDKMIELKGSRGHSRDRFWSACGSHTALDPSLLKIVLDKFAVEANTNLLFHSLVTDVIVKVDSIRGVVVENKSGRQLMLGKVIVDATGDGDVAARAGAPFEKGGEDGRMMQVSMLIRMGDVHRKKILQYIKENPEDFIIGEDPSLEISRDEVVSGLEDLSEAPEIGGFFSKVKLAIENGEMHPFSPRGGVNIQLSPREDEVFVYGTNMVGVDGTDAWDMSRAEVALRDQAIILVDFLKKYVPGFELSHLIDIAPQVGVRETRRILGEYVLTAEDVIGGRKFEDVIAKGSNPVDLHSKDDPTKVIHRFVKDGGSYDVPYRCLVPRKIEKLLVAGRCISATHEGMASARTAVTCMAEGQAADTAAALSVKNEVEPRNLDTKKLKDLLIEQGAILYGTH